MLRMLKAHPHLLHGDLNEMHKEGEIARSHRSLGAKLLTLFCGKYLRFVQKDTRFVASNFCEGKLLKGV